MKVAALYTYPIKAGPAMAVDRITAVPRGVENDRRLMVTDANGVFRTQRQHPEIGRLKLDWTARGLRLRHDDVGEVFVGAARGPAIEVEIWGDRVQAMRTSEEVDEFLTTLVGAPVHLVYMPDEAERLTRDGAPLSFVDQFPFLVTTVASLDDLNARIEGPPVPMLAFRPNIVIEGAAPWAEDTWGDLQVGAATLRCTGRCERCSVTTLDPEFPDRPRRDGEPLRTLAKFRRNDAGGVDFGRHAILAAGGDVHVFDEVSG